MFQRTSASLFALLGCFLASSPSPSLAQGGVDMGCSTTVADPCNGSGSGDGGETSTSEYREQAPAPDPMQAYRARYAAALQQLQGLVGGLDAVSDAEPDTISDLSARLSVIYVGAAYRLDSLNAARADVGRVLADANEDVKWQTDKIQSLKERMTSAGARKAAAVTRLGSLNAELKRLNDIKSSLEHSQAALDKSAEARTERIVQWLSITGLPKAQQPARPFAHQRPAADAYVPAEFYGERDLPAFVVPDLPRWSPVPGEGVPFRSSPGGSVDEVLAAVETLAPQIRSASEALAAESPQAAEAEATANAAAIELRTTTQFYRDVEGGVHYFEQRIGRVTSLIDFTRQDCNAAARNMMREAVVTTILSRLEPQAVAAVKEFITINSDARQIAALTNEKVASLYKAGQGALRLPVGAQVRGMDKFLEAQKTILAAVKNPFQSAIDGANAMASGNPNSGTAEALAAFRGLRRDGLDILEAASDKMPGHARDIATKLVDDAD